MKKYTKHIIAPSIFVLAVACAEGGSGRDINEVPTNTAPTIQGPSSVSVEENTRSVAIYTTSDAEGNAVSLSVTGADAASFSISNQGELSFSVPADFEAPADTDADNIYQVTIVADDSFTTPTELAVTVTVTDVVGDGIPQTSNLVSTDDSTFIQENIIESFEFPTLVQNDNNITVSGVFSDAGIAAAGWNNFEGDQAARIGDASVSTCEITGTPGDCDAPQGEILIENIAVTQGSITFLMSGGAGTNNVGVEVINPDDGSVLGRYTPNSCGDPFLRGDQHYVHFETSGLIGSTVSLRIFDEESGGCGFVAFDHFYQTEKARGPQAGSLSKPLPATNVSKEAAADTGLIPQASFEAPADMVANRGWVATGAFADPTQTSWEGTARSSNPAAARLGDWAVSTCEMNDNASGCDAPTGTLTSPSFRVAESFLNFLMAGGNGSAPVGVRLLDGAGEVIHTFQPDTCGPSHIDGDDDWTAIDVSALLNASIKLQIFDEEPGGCGFVSFDHFYQGPAAYNPAGTGKDGGTVVLTPASETNLGFNVTLAEDSFVQVIGSFDDATANDWVQTGAFIGPTAAESWSNLNNPGRVGPRGINTCEINFNAMGCDVPTGTITSPSFMVDSERPFLNFLMAGGNGTAPVGLRVLDTNDNELALHTPNACDAFGLNGDDDWVSMDLTDQVGQMVKVEVFDNEAGGCGFVAVDHVHMSGTAR